MTFNELVQYALTDMKIINSSQSLATPRQQYASFYASYPDRVVELQVGDILHGQKQIRQVTFCYSYINDRVKRTTVVHG